MDCCNIGSGGFRKIVDELGGVEINVPFDMVYDDPGRFAYKSGRRVYTTG